jgi:Zn-dependent protease with chaperone function
MRIRSSPAVRLPRLLPPTRYVMLRVILLTSVGLVDLLLMSQQRDMAIGMRGDDSGHIVMWLLTCRLLPIATSCAGTLIILRMVRSARRQRTQTLAALRPLLAQPPLTAPARVVPLLQSLQLEQRTLLIACDIPVALCYGLLYPRLLVSTAALSGLSSPELEAMLRHEQAHLCRRDPLRRLFMRALTEALPLPALQAIADAVPLAQELAADRVVLAAVGPEALSGALLKVGDALDTLEEVPTGSSNREWRLAVGAFSSIDARIDQILGVPIAGQPGAASLVLPLLVLVLLASGPLLCLLLPFPTPIVWAGGVLAAASWQRLRLPTRRLTRQGP